MYKPKVLIFSGHGINCEIETQKAFEIVDAYTEIIHLNNFFNTEININNYDIIVFPGGFSFGDDLGAGIVLSAKLKKYIAKFNNFINNGGYIIGICNGFQVLVNLGLLTNINAQENNELALIENDNKTFIDNWVKLKVNKNNNSPFFKDIDEIYLPIRHQEGKLIIGNNKIKEEIIKNNLNVLTYENNPNGSELDIAALTDKSGHILGMMPHPEAFLTIYNHPNWSKLKKDKANISQEGQGLQIFKNIVTHIKKQRS